MTMPFRRAFFSFLAAVAMLFAGLPSAVSAQVTAFKQAVAEAAADDREVAEFYQQNGYNPIWTIAAIGPSKDARLFLLR